MSIHSRIFLQRNRNRSPSNCSNTSLLILLVIFLSVFSKDQLDVLQIRNVDFPSSKFWPATFQATYEKEIPEFTICIRFLLESYNNNLFEMVRAENKDSLLYFLDRIGWETGMERDGYQGGVLYLYRVIPENGIRGNFPTMHHYNIPRNIDTSKA